MGRPRAVPDEQIVAAARRCFLERGTVVSAAEIASELGVSHTTVFHRFGSKENLLLAALGPPKSVPWVAALDAGPDDRPIREQLIEHAKVISAYYQEMQAGFAVLRAAGIDPFQTVRKRKGVAPPVQAFQALVGWLERAQAQRRIGRCDIDTLASTILGALHGWALTARVCGESTTAAAGARHVERFVDLLWTGIAGVRGRSA